MLRRSHFYENMRERTQVHTPTRVQDLYQDPTRDYNVHER